MDKILNRICSINNHPVSLLDVNFKVKYLKGLGACLYTLSKNSPVTKMMFIVWAESILRETINPSIFWKEDVTAVKSAISMQRKGFRFFSMKYHFFFDALYLMEGSLQGKFRTESYFIVKYIEKTFCGRFTKSALNKVILVFSNKAESVNYIDAALFAHRQKNIKYTNQKERKILVVANVSAGKSTLINALIGQRINKMRTTACTNKLVYLHNKQEMDGVTIKTADAAFEYYTDVTSINSDKFIHASLPFNSLLSQSAICIVDTPGINNSLDSNHKKITEDAIKSNDYDIVVYVSNCQYFGTNDERDILLFLKRHVKKPVIFVLNQLDRFKSKEDSITKMLNDYKCDLQQKFGFDNPVIIPVSAHAAILSKLNDKYLDEDDIFDKEAYIKKFQRDYYNLPAYVSEINTMDFQERTGIKLLENQILKL